MGVKQKGAYYANESNDIINISIDDAGIDQLYFP